MELVWETTISMCVQSICQLLPVNCCASATLWWLLHFFSLRFIGWTIFWSLRCQQNEIFCRPYVLVARIQISWALTTTARIVQMISVPNDLNVWFGWYHVKHSKVSTLFILDHFSEMLCYFIIDASSPWHKYIWHLFPRPYSIVHIVPFETSKKNHFLNR